MIPEYKHVIADLRSRAQKLLDAADVLESVTLGTEDSPPALRPQLPGPPSTNGAGHDDKVLRALKGGPLAPIAIRQVTGIAPWTLPGVLSRLTSANRIAKIGNGPRGTKYQLAAA